MFQMKQWVIRLYLTFHSILRDNVLEDCSIFKILSQLFHSELSKIEEKTI